MHLIRFRTNDSEARLGVLLPDQRAVVNLSAVGNELDIGVADTMEQFLAEPRYNEKANLIADYARDTGKGLVDRADVELLAPLGDPQKIVCVGLNYIEHIDESGEEPPENPVLFSKYSSSITAPGTDIAWDPSLTSEVDYEVELTVVIGDQARRIKEQDATEYIAGYTVANDVSARDLQFADEQWVRGKTLDTFCPLGPAIVTPDEIQDPEDLTLWSELNGERMQESTTENLIFGIDELVSFCSQAFTLSPGDIILTGTPTGVGAFRDPPVYLEDGDEITVGVEGVGEITNECREEP